MKNSLRLTIAVVVTLISSLGFSTFATAQKKDFGLSKTVEATGNLLPQKIGGAETVPQLIGTIVSSVLGFLGIIFFLLIFYAGLIWMTAQGSDEKIERAKEIISAAVVGLVIVLAAYAFTQFVFDQLGSKTGSQSSSANSSAPADAAAEDNTALCAAITDETICANNFSKNCIWYIDAAKPNGGLCKFTQ